MKDMKAKAAAVAVLMGLEQSLSALIAPLSATQTELGAARNKLLEFESALGLKPKDTDTLEARMGELKAAAARGFVSDLQLSTAPLINPAGATLDKLASAEAALAEYETAFGILFQRGTYGERMAKVQAAAEKALARNLPQPLPASQRESLSDSGIAQQSAAIVSSLETADQLRRIVTSEVIAELVAPATVLPAATPEGVLVELPDPRAGFGPHKAYLFLGAASQGTVREELEALLGKERAKILAQDWGDRCDLDQVLQETQIAVFINSNGLDRTLSLNRSVTTTQEQDFTSVGYMFASDEGLTLHCARQSDKWSKRIPLSEAEQDLKQKLSRRGGALRSHTGNVVLESRTGDLRANFRMDEGGRFIWACGTPREVRS